MDRVEIAVGGSTCTGYLFRPARAGGQVPCVVLAQGFSGTQDRLFDVAERFAGAGIATLTFDYRSFGESAGEPRQVVDLARQREDIRAAVAFARRMDDIAASRIALWGNSLGGAHVVVVAATDPRIAAVVSQMPFNGFPSKVEGRSARQTLRLLAAMLRDAWRGRRGKSPFYIPMIGGADELAVTSTHDAQRYLEVLKGASTTWKNQVAPRGLLQMMRYRPEAAARQLSAPLLVCAAEQDDATPLDHVRRLASAAPHSALRTYPVGHFEFYRDPATRQRVLDDQVAFLREHLQVTT